MPTPAQPTQTIDIAPGTAADAYRYVPAIVPRNSDAAAPIAVWPARSTAGFAIAAALTLREQNPGSVAAVYMHNPHGFESPNGLPPRPTNHVDSNGKPLFMYLVG